MIEIELTDICKEYEIHGIKTQALIDINLSVQKGEIFGVIGRSGAGKSTLIRCVNLLERPTSGSVKVKGKELTTLSDRALRQVRHQIGMVFQHFNLLARRDVYSNIALPLQLLKKSKREIEAAVIPLLELIGLRDRARVYPNQLSGGQKQRVAIARALATKPTVLLCDEMTSALDPETTASILSLIKEINDQMKLSILMITHEMEVIKSIADHVAVIDHGRIIEQSDVVSLFKHPKTEVAKTFTESVLGVHLPALLQHQIRSEPSPGAHAIVRIAFTGTAAAEPVIDELIRSCDVHINILQASLEFLRSDTIGMMLVSLRGETGTVERAVKMLVNKGLTVEVIGYVAADDWSFS